MGITETAWVDVIIMSLATDAKNVKKENNSGWRNILLRMYLSLKMTCTEQSDYYTIKSVQRNVKECHI